MGSRNRISQLPTRRHIQMHISALFLSEGGSWVQLETCWQRDPTSSILSALRDLRTGKQRQAQHALLPAPPRNSPKDRPVHCNRKRGRDRDVLKAILNLVSLRPFHSLVCLNA
uniref:Uncharacterized protein n=1 Tax=Sphaerodactylus townsendi TaxID=933632 RepID=A0ACB8G9E0_9SAUR